MPGPDHPDDLLIVQFSDPAEEQRFLVGLVSSFQRNGQSLSATCVTATCVTATSGWPSRPSLNGLPPPALPRG